MSRTTRLPLASGLLAAALLSGCSALQGLAGGVEPERDEETGAVVEAAQADAFALRVGDCVNATGTVTSEEVEDVQSMPTVPCADAHDGEVYAAHDIADESYPGDEAVALQADEFCYAEFEPFVGMAYEDSVLEFTTLFPSGDSWELMDDREILCIVVDAEAGVTGTLAGAQY